MVERGIAGPPYKATADTLTIRGLSLQDCIEGAWQTPPARIVAPAWLNDVRLEIVAKAAAPSDEKQLQMMLRSLLEERMGLKVHTERKESPVYALTVDKRPAFCR